MIKYIISLLLFLFYMNFAYALTCPAPEQISYQNDKWQLPENWYIKEPPDKGTIIKFHYSTWVGLGHLKLFQPSEGIKGYVTCNYKLIDEEGKKGWLSIIYDDPQERPDTPGWGVYYHHIMLPHVNYHCYADKVEDCEV